MRHEPATILLYRPVDQQELDLIAALRWLAFPIGLPTPPVFYSALNEEHAAQLACSWDAPSCGIGYLVRFALDADYAALFPLQKATGYAELHIPAAELAEFNQHILGQIQITSVFSY